jgi:probable poly-beta-1,6-N-acetyl-D-glucosamine export protein
MKPKTYDVAVDALRVVSILAVILIHTSTKILQAGNNDVVGLPVAMVVNQVSRFSVPLFFMISGFVLELSHKDESYFNYLKRRVNKILIPYVVWTVIYGLLVYPQGLASLPRLLVFGGAAYQLYFIPAILVFYLIFPLLHRAINFISNKWVMLLLLGGQMWLLSRDYYIRPWGVPESVKIPFLAFWVFLVGMIVVRNKEQVVRFLEKYKWVFGTAAVIMAGYIYWEGLSGYVSSHNYYVYYSQWRPSVLVYTIILAGALYFWFDKLKNWSAVVSKVSSLAFFVFFVHVIILESAWKLLSNKPLVDGWLFMVVTGVSFGLGAIVHKLGGLKRLTG